MNRYGASVTPETELLYNNSGSAIPLGTLVTWSGSTSDIEDPIPEPAMGKKPMLDNQATRTAALTRPTQGIMLYGGTVENAPIGVARDAIADGDWGEVCVGIGPCDVRIGISSNIAANDYLIGTAGGLFIEDSTSVTAVTTIHAMALEATITSGTCAAALISAVLNLGNAGAMGKHA
jgi:hypothetical protein